MEQPFEEKKNTPRPDDLLNLEVEVSKLGRGDKVHDIEHCMGMLRRIMKQSEQEGWPEWLLNSWNEYYTEINKLIAKIKVQKLGELEK